MQSKFYLLEGIEHEFRKAVLESWPSALVSCLLIFRKSLKLIIKKSMGAIIPRKAMLRNRANLTMILDSILANDSLYILIELLLTNAWYTASTVLFRMIATGSMLRPNTIGKHMATDIARHRLIVSLNGNSIFASFIQLPIKTSCLTDRTNLMQIIRYARTVVIKLKKYSW